MSFTMNSDLLIDFNFEHNLFSGRGFLRSAERALLALLIRNSGSFETAYILSFYSQELKATLKPI